MWTPWLGGSGVWPPPQMGRGAPSGVSPPGAEVGLHRCCGIGRGGGVCGNP